jgi:tetratricopeptide (TPR) repeat protein
MRRRIWLGLAALAVAAAGIGLFALGRAPEATTTSPEALAEFEAALEAEMKLYKREAIEHLERALELDPDFVLAKVMLSDNVLHYDPERSGRLLGEASATNLEHLTARERLIVQRSVALREKREEDAIALLDQYLERYPNDAWAVFFKAEDAWRRGEVQDADRFYRRLIDISPNWAIAYNMLGYLAMREGKFEQAEEYLTSYRFIAPDQANPHDSLGELFIVTGRYQDAEVSFEEALRIKSDFYSSYKGLMMIHILERDLDRISQVVERAAAVEDFSDSVMRDLECTATFAKLFETRSWAELVDLRTSDCVEEWIGGGYPTAATHLAACRRGDFELAKSFEDGIYEWAGKKAKGSGKLEEQLPVTYFHLQGARLALEGDLEAAEERLRQADAKLDYTNSGYGIFKLHNRLYLVEVLFAQDRDAEAHQLLTKVRAVNPALAQDFEEQGLELLGVPGRY